MDCCSSWLWQFLCLLVYRLMSYVSCFVLLVNLMIDFVFVFAICDFLSLDANTLIITRRFVGVGEASFISLAAPFIDDNAPQKQVSVWILFWTSYEAKCTTIFINLVLFIESCMAGTVLHVYTKWCCSWLCLWRIRKLYLMSKHF